MTVLSNAVLQNSIIHLPNVANKVAVLSKIAKSHESFFKTCLMLHFPLLQFPVLFTQTRVVGQMSAEVITIEHGVGVSFSSGTVDGYLLSLPK